MPNRRPRSEFTKATKAQAWDRCEDEHGVHRCEQCTAPLQTGYIHYDHEIPTSIKADNSLSNCQVLCTSCHEGKTRVDRKIIAKAHRIEERHSGMKEKKSSGWQRTHNGRPIKQKIGGGVVYKDTGERVI